MDFNCYSHDFCLINKGSFRIQTLTLIHYRHCRKTVLERFSDLFVCYWGSIIQLSDPKSLCSVILLLRGTKIKTSLTILKQQNRAFQIWDYLTFPLRIKQRFSRDEITNLRSLEWLI